MELSCVADFIKLPRVMNIDPMCYGAMAWAGISFTTAHIFETIL